MAKSFDKKHHARWQRKQAKRKQITKDKQTAFDKLYKMMFVKSR